jgi:hypothetical protein
MFTRSTPKPLPREFLEWQVVLRRHTMVASHGAPHVGVAPLVTVKRPGGGPGFVSHSIICGLLPQMSKLAQRTADFRAIYESSIGDGARAVYDKGIEFLLDYYESAGQFDPVSITTLLPAKLPLVDALRAEPRCALVFYVFDLADKTEVGRFRCWNLDARAELLTRGPVYDNVWWHNALFHGPVDEHVVVHFRHEQTVDTRFGAYTPVT